MRRASFEDMHCSIARSLEVIGEWWTILILRDAFLGVTRFDDFQKRLGIATNTLTARLDKLVGSGVMEKRTYEEARRRADYVLTAKGRALWPVMVTLRQWGDEWETGAGNEPTELIHEPCGHRTHAILTCDHCGERLYGRDLRTVLGPGPADPAIVEALGGA